MAQIPDGKTVRVINPILTDFVNALVQERSQFKYDQMFDGVDAERTGSVWLKNALDGMGDDDIDLERAPGTEFRRDEGNLPALTSYTLRNYGRERTLADEIEDDSQLPYDLAQDIAEDLTDIVLIAREVLGVAYYFDNTRFTTTNIAATSVQWNAPGSKPFSDLDALYRRIELAAQNGPVNGLIMGRDVGHAFASNTDVLNSMSVTRDRFGAVEWPLLQEKLSAKYAIPVENIIHHTAIRNTAARGLTQANAAIAGDFLWMGNMKQSQARAVRGGIRTKGVAAIAARKRPSGPLGVPASEAPDIYVSMYREEKSKKTVIRVERDGVIVPLRNASGGLLEDLVA